MQALQIAHSFSNSMPKYCPRLPNYLFVYICLQIDRIAIFKNGMVIAAFVLVAEHSSVLLHSDITPRKNAMPTVTHAAHKKGDFFVDYEEKIFEDVKAKPGEKALVSFHTVAFEGSIGFVNMLQATRLQRKGYETSILLYGPGVNLGVQRGFPTLGDEAFPGHMNFNNQLIKFMTEGGKVYACRFALQALYGHGEPSLIPGIIPINPLDVLDLKLLHFRSNAVQIDTWTV